MTPARPKREPQGDFERGRAHAAHHAVTIPSRGSPPCHGTAANSAAWLRQKTTAPSRVATARAPTRHTGRSAARSTRVLDAAKTVALAARKAAGQATTSVAAKPMWETTIARAIESGRAKSSAK